MWIAFGVICGFLFLTIILLFVTSCKIYKKLFNKRYDDNHTLKYYAVSDFEGLVEEKVYFNNNKGEQLAGFIYKYILTEYKGVIIFSHGLGAGHKPYMKEIELLAKDGFMIFAINYTGCLESKGDKFPGYPQAVADLQKALEYCDTNDELKKYKKILIGHETGAYASINILKFYKNISGIVALSPFINSSDHITNCINKASFVNMKSYKVMFKLLDKVKFGKYAQSTSAITIVSQNVKMLFVAGNKDTIVSPSLNFELLQKEARGDETKRFMMIDNRFNRPELTVNAANYDNDTNEDYYRLFLENKCNIPQDKIDEFYSSLDYEKLNELDERVITSIIKFINECL